MVRATGVEPARRGHQILSLARLPIPPRPHLFSYVVFILVFCFCLLWMAAALRASSHCGYRKNLRVRVARSIFSTAAALTCSLFPPPAAVAVASNSATPAFVYLCSFYIGFLFLPLCKPRLRGKMAMKMPHTPIIFNPIIIY